jgi:hypothetical protein
MSTTTMILLGILYIIITGTNLLYPYRCNNSPFWMILASIIPIFNACYLVYRLSLCSECSHAVHANVFFSSSASYEHYKQEKEKYKRMRSQFDEFKNKRKKS